MQHGNAYDFALEHVHTRGMIALFPSGDDTLCYVTWGLPQPGGVVHTAAFNDDPQRRALAAAALIKVARDIHSEVEA